MRIDLIKSEMAKKSITQKMLSERLGIALTSVNNKLTEKNNFTDKEIETLCEIFGCSPNYLFKGE